ncbi:tetratricopeptide repeat protein [Labrys neptuniae]
MIFSANHSFMRHGMMPAALTFIVLATSATAQSLSPRQARDLCFGTEISNERWIEACGALITAKGVTRKEQAAAYNNRGLAYYIAGATERAIRDVDKAIELDPTLPHAYFTRGKIAGSQGDYVRALSNFNKATSLSPRYAEAFAYRGYAEEAMGNRDKALQDYDQAVSLKPDYAIARRFRGGLNLSMGKLDDAIRDLDQAIRLDADDAEALHNRGLALFKKGEFDRALKDFDDTLRLRPQDATVYRNRGLALANLKNYDRAIQDFSEALRLKPDYVDALSSRGQAYKENGDYDRAIADFDAALRLQPKNSTVLLARAAANSARVTARLTGKQPAAKPVVTIPTETMPANPAAVFGAERRVALVIGNSAYRSVGLLPNPARDGDLVASALRQNGIDVTVVRDLDRGGMVDALQSFADKADAADWAVIYYAGHGIEVNGTNYLIPIDARLRSDRDVPDEAVTLQRLLSSIEGARKLRLVVLDACRDNPFASRMRMASASRSVSRGLARVEPTNATLVVYAAKEGTTAADGDAANSPFAAAFAKRIVQPGMEINKVFRFVRQDVLAATGNRQEPFVYGSLPPEDFYFRATP